MRNRTLRISWVMTLGLLLAALSVALGDRVLARWAYAVERGRIQAAGDELADVQQVAGAFRLVARVARPGVVHIRVSGGQNADAEELEREFRERFGDRLDAEELREWIERHRRLAPASGSGVIFDAQGHILTNNHVVSGREEFRVRLNDERIYEARLVGTDPKTDLAVLKIDAPDLQPLSFGDSDRMEVGDWVLAVGAPFGLDQTVTHGIVSATGRTQVQGVDIFYQNFIQTDAAINPGNSGGPLLNLRGEVIGINTAIATNGDSFNAGIAFTIPSNMAVKVARELIERGEVARGWLGIQMAELNAEELRLLGVDRPAGVMVDVVYEDMPAYRAGLQVEDVILAIDGQPVTRMHEIRARVADIKPGEPARLTVARDGQEREIQVRLGRQPDEVNPRQLPRAIVGRPIDGLGAFGRTLRPDRSGVIGADLRLRAGEIPSDHGVMIVAVAGERSTSDVKLEDLIVECDGKPVRTVGELNAALAQKAARGASLELVVLDPQGDRRTVQFKPRRP